MKKLVNGQLVDLTQAEITARQAEEAANLDAELMARVSSYANEKLNGGIVVSGVSVDTSESSRNFIAGAVNRALVDDDNTLTYKYHPPGGAAVNLTNAQFIAIGVAIATHVQKCLDAKAVVQGDIDDYSTIAEIEAAFDTAYST